MCGDPGWPESKHVNPNGCIPSAIEGALRYDAQNLTTTVLSRDFLSSLIAIGEKQAFWKSSGKSARSFKSVWYLSVALRILPQVLQSQQIRLYFIYSPSARPQPCTSLTILRIFCRGTNPRGLEMVVVCPRSNLKSWRPFWTRFGSFLML